MELHRLSFYKGRLVINLLARDLDNAVEVLDVLDGNGLVGVLSKDFPSVEACAQQVRDYLKRLPNVSVGMGGGDPKQAMMAAQVAALTDPGHVNQTFTGAMYTEGLLTASGCDHTVTNCMIYPTDTPGLVQISTGAVSDSHKPGIVDVETAVCMMRDLDLPSVKFFNLHGTKHIESLKVMAQACARFGITMIEPTGGLDPENVAQIVQVCLDAGVEHVMPHIYSSIIDKSTGLTRPELAKRAYDSLTALL